MGQRLAYKVGPQYSTGGPRADSRPQGAMTFKIITATYINNQHNPFPGRAGSMWTWFRGWCDRNDKPVVVITSVCLVLIAGFSFLNVPYLILGIIATFFLGFILGAFTHSRFTPQEPKSKSQPKVESVPAPSSTQETASEHEKIFDYFREDGFLWPYTALVNFINLDQSKVEKVENPICGRPQCKAEVTVSEGQNLMNRRTVTSITCPRCKKSTNRYNTINDWRDHIKRLIEAEFRKGFSRPKSIGLVATSFLTEDETGEDVLVVDESGVGPPPPMKKKEDDPHATIRPEDLVKTPKTVVRDRTVCPQGPHIVEAGKSRYIKLDVQPGDTIIGDLLETKQSNFIYLFYDEKRRLKYMTEYAPTPLDWGYDEYKYRVDIEIPYTPRGPWYLVLDAKEKSTDLEVEAILKTVDM